VIDWKGITNTKHWIRNYCIEPYKNASVMHCTMWW